MKLRADKTKPHSTTLRRAASCNGKLSRSAVALAVPCMAVQLSPFYPPTTAAVAAAAAAAGALRAGLGRRLFVVGPARDEHVAPQDDVGRLLGRPERRLPYKQHAAPLALARTKNARSPSPLAPLLLLLLPAQKVGHANALTPYTPGSTRVKF